MPHVVNGCGTWYYGRSNEERYQGACSQCGYTGELTSYDTRLFIVFLFVPVFPLGAKRIIDDCPSCRRHMALPLREWRTMKERLTHAMREFEERPDDRDLALEALAANAGFRYREGIDTLAPLLEKHLGHDAEVLAGLASVQGMFGNVAEQERLLRRAIELKDDDEQKEALAWCLMNQRRADEAASCLEHIRRKGIPDKVDLLYRLAQLFQIQGQHAKALATFNDCLAINPLIEQDEVFRRLKEASEEGLHAGGPVDPARIQREYQRGQSMQRVRRYAPPVVALALVAYCVVAAARGSHRQVYLVNGLDHPYTVKVAGVEQVVTPETAAMISVAEGDLEISCPGLPAPANSAKVELRTPFWSRPFSSEVFVLNPDRCALVCRVRVWYSPRPGGACEPTHRFSGGRLLMEFSGIDDPFREFPRSITTSGGGSHCRDGLSVIAGTRLARSSDLLESVRKDLGDDAVIEMGARLLSAASDSAIGHALLMAVGSPGKAVALLEPGLSRRPVEVDWHRCYQDAMQAAGRAARTRELYREWLAADPSNPGLQYLEARACDDPDRWDSVLSRLAASPSAPRHVLASLCGRAMGSARFDEALRAARQLAGMRSSTASDRDLLHQALLASGRTSELIALLRRPSGQEDPGAGLLLVDVLALSGHEKEAREALGRLAAITSKTPDPEVTRAVLESRLLYDLGKTGEAADRLARVPDKRLEKNAWLLRGDTAHTAEILADDPDARHALGLYLALHQQGRAASPEARRCLEAAAKQIAPHAPDYAAALTGAPPRPAAEMVKRYAPLELKAAILAILGLLDPAGRTVYFDRARKLNYRPGFPRHVVQAVVDASGR